MFSLYNKCFCIVLFSFTLLACQSESTDTLPTEPAPEPTEPAPEPVEPAPEPVEPAPEPEPDPTQLEKTTLSSPVLSLNPVVFFDFESNPDQSPLDLEPMALLQMKHHDGVNPVTVPGAKGNGWDFSDTNSSAIIRGGLVNSLGNPELHSGFSISLWLKPNSSAPNSRLGGGGYGNQWEISFGNPGVIRVGIGPAAVFLPGSSGLDDGQWHHIAAVADFTATTDNVNLYLDGVLLDTASYSYQQAFYDYRIDHPLYLGGRPNGASSSDFKGAMDEFAMFNRALSASDISLLMTHDSKPIELALPELEMGPTVVLNGPTASFTPQVKLRNVDASAAGYDLQWRVSGNRNDVTISNTKIHNPTVSFSSEKAYDSVDLILRVTTQDTWVEESLTVTMFKNETPDTRVFAALPPVGVHPRLLFSATELPTMRVNYQSSSVAQDGAEYIKNQLATARDGDALYQSMASGNTAVDVSDETARGLFATLIADGASVALMENNQALLNELAVVLSTFAQATLAIYEPNYDNPLTHDADINVAIAYDLLFNHMDKAGQDTVRTLLAKMSRYRMAFGCNKLVEGPAGNWDLYHDGIVLAALAIEGEEGYDPFIFECNIRKLRSFLTTYGLHEQGFAHEGEGYLNFGFEKGSLSMLATAYRDENFFKTTRLYKNLQAKLREMQPWPMGAMYSHHDGQNWGTGFYNGNIFYVSQHVFPTDYVADRVAQRYIDHHSEARKRKLASVLFARPAIVENTSIESAASSASMALSVFETERGLVNTRSSWGPNALKLAFECRMDMYVTGHVHNDRNMFTFAALGKQWITDQGYHEISNDMHATVLIDGIGQPVSKLKRWPSMPGKFLEYADSSEMTLAAGDARLAYTYHRGEERGETSEELDSLGIPASVQAVLDTPATETFTWADFVYAGTPESEIPDWKKQNTLNDVSFYNPVQRAFRTVLLAKGAHPYALIVDDIQKDNDSHEYEWSAPVSNDTQMNPGRVIIESASNTQAILRFEDDTEEGSPRLLVKVIQADGTVLAPVKIVTRNIGVYGSEPKPYDLLVIQREVVTPNFKVLLYPFRDGDSLPDVQWDGTNLSLEFDEQTEDRIQMSEDSDGRIKINFERFDQ